MSRIFITTVVSLYSIQRTSTLSIEPVTPAVNLTEIFTQPNYPTLSGIDSGFMTYYIDPNDSTKTKYVWLGTNIKINESTIASYVLSDVFTVLFAEYPPINGTFDIVNELSPNATTFTDVLMGNIMCTSPQTNDIMTCWINVTWTNITTPTYQIDCRLYFVKTNTFSNIIQITNDKNGLNFGYNVLCFNDSYFIPYSHTVINIFNITPSDVTLYGTLIDLKGVIKYSRVQLKNIGKLLPTGFVPVFTVAGAQFNPREIDSRATNLFSINYEMTNSSTNVTHLVGLYGYYTGIDDTNFPIYIYNETELNSRLEANNEINGGPNTVLNWYSACCYISIYVKYIDYNSSQIIYGIITDTHGSKIKVAQYPNFEDLLLINGASGDVLPQIIDLPMISTEFVHYFGVVYGRYEERSNANTTMIRVYYLEFDENNAQFDLIESGEFEAVKLMENDNENIETFFGGVTAYNVPGTNYVCFVWTQDFWSFEIGQDSYKILGQTFVVN